jgi:hypothetical protein
LDGLVIRHSHGGLLLLDQVDRLLANLGDASVRRLAFSPVRMFRNLPDFLDHFFASAQQLFRFDQNFRVFLERGDFFASQVLQYMVLPACHPDGFHDLPRWPLRVSVT